MDRAMPPIDPKSYLDGYTSGLSSGDYRLPSGSDAWAGAKAREQHEQEWAARTSSSEAPVRPITDGVPSSVGAGAGGGIVAFGVLFLIFVGPVFEIALISKYAFTAARFLLPASVWTSPLSNGWFANTYLYGHASLVNLVTWTAGTVLLAVLVVTYYGRWASLAITATIPIYSLFRYQSDPAFLIANDQILVWSILFSLVLYRVLISAATKRTTWKRTAAGFACSIAVASGLAGLYRASEAATAAALEAATMVKTTQYGFAFPTPPKPLARSYTAHSNEVFNVVGHQRDKTIVCINGTTMAFANFMLTAYLGEQPVGNARLNTTHLSDRCT
jgi:hypothetical protein